MADKIWVEVSSKSPCFICGKSDWCSVSRDGGVTICRRLDTGEGVHKMDRNGGDYWMYFRDGRTTKDFSSPPPTDDHEGERADPDTLNRLYSALLSLLTLSTAHRNNLLKRGLTDDAIESHAYKTLPLQGRAKLARQLVDRYGSNVCYTVPGLYLKSDGSNGDKYWSLAGSPGILIPIRDVQGRVIALKVRRDD